MIIIVISCSHQLVGQWVHIGFPEPLAVIVIDGEGLHTDQAAPPKNNYINPMKGMKPRI